MALQRLQRDEVYRFVLAHPLAFEDWENPTVAELNQNPDNDPSGLVFNITCAVQTDGTTFDLADPETDDSLSFCQRAGTSEVISRSTDITFQFFESAERWTGVGTAEETGFNTATLTKSLLMWRGQEYFAIMSVGESEDAPFAEGDRIKMARVATDYATPVTSAGAMTAWSSATASRGDINWNYELTA